MLRFLNITNFAVIQRLSFELHSGLNLLTGETGAGKSIIVDALSLLLGGRASAGLVRTGERAALVEGLFDLSGESELRARSILAEVGIDKRAEDDLCIRREVQAGGRSRIFINDQSVTAATLKKLQTLLIEIHGQGEQQALVTTRTHMEMLDSFVGCEDLRNSAGLAYARWKKAVVALRSLERDEATRERACDMLRFQIAEIEKAAPRSGEDEELQAERTFLAHAGKALELSSGAFGELYERDGSILSKLAVVRRRLQELNAIDPRVNSWLENLDTAIVSLTDAAEGLRGYGQNVDFSPARLGEIEDRLAEWERLKRKYGRDLQGLLEVRDDLNRQLQQLSNLAERENELLSEVEAAAQEYTPIANRLTTLRREAVRSLEERARDELRQVALERASFVVNVTTAINDKTDDVFIKRAEGESDNASSSSLSFWSPYGADHVEFMFSANVGEVARPLARVASGGELSRLMLALRTVCGVARTASDEVAEAGTIIFDEIDAGIGGRVATAVGQRLKNLAAARQVLCVTHQAQIARFADHHYVVTKGIENERTVTTVRELKGEERIGELARMIGGTETVSTAREMARWMLENSETMEVLDATEKSVKTGASDEGAAKGQQRARQKGKGSRHLRKNSATLAERK